MRLRSVAARVFVVALFAVVAASTASAGTLTVSVNSAQDIGCGIFSASSSTDTIPCGTDPDGYFGIQTGYNSGVQGTTFLFQATAPPGITINNTHATTLISNVNDVNGTPSWGGDSFFDGGGTLWHSGDTSESDYGFNSSYWGFRLTCGDATCGEVGTMLVSAVTLTATENTGPNLDPLGTNNLFGEDGGWVWNPPGDPWPIPVSASDPSGVCSLDASVNDDAVLGPSASPVQSVWQQCPEPTWSSPTVDTRSYIPDDGTLPLYFQATNAAGVTSTSATAIINVDNDPVGVSLTTLNDANPTVWVNHSVTVTATPTAGPSGIGGLGCTVDGNPTTLDPNNSFTVDGDGLHTVSCTASNNAVDPQGDPNTGTGTEQIAIDEAPPAVSFEPENPSDPTQLVADTSDAESGVAGGQISVTAPGSSTPVALPTQFDGSHLIASFDDAGLHGAYTFTADSCDAVSNCASTSETLTLPVRLAARSDISFRAIRTPAKIVRKRVRVGFHYKREHRHGKAVRVKVGGHLERIRIVIPSDEACSVRRVRVARHRWREIKACRVLKIKTVTGRRVRFGRKVTVHGLALTAQGAPLAGVPITIKTAPIERGALFHVVKIVTTRANGTWAATLPAGPSRIIHADYLGSGTVLPAVGRATVSVPAKISVSITPRHIPWSGSIRIRGHLDGGYIPPDGVALRLLVRYPGTKRGTPILALRTNRHGGFSFTWSYHSGRGTATYPFSVATTATESDYPFAAANSRAIPITFGP